MADTSHYQYREYRPDLPEDEKPAWEHEEAYDREAIATEHADHIFETEKRQVRAIEIFDQENPDRIEIIHIEVESYKPVFKVKEVPWT